MQLGQKVDERLAGATYLPMYDPSEMSELWTTVDYNGWK